MHHINGNKYGVKWDGEGQEDLKIVTLTIEKHGLNKMCGWDYASEVPNRDPLNLTEHDQTD